MVDLSDEALDIIRYAAAKGEKFFSRIQAEESGGMSCPHNNISKSIDGFFGSQREKA